MERPETPSGGEWREQAVVGVRTVFDDAARHMQASLALDGFDGGE